MRNTTLDQEVRALSKITDNPSLHALSYALRHPEMWPSDFTWDYSDCYTCAIGLALRLWPTLKLPDDKKDRETWIARQMAMSHREAIHIFFGLGPRKRVGFFRIKSVLDFDAVTADDVADSIDRYLAEHD